MLKHTCRQRRTAHSLCISCRFGSIVCLAHRSALAAPLRCCLQMLPSVAAYAAQAHAQAMYQAIMHMNSVYAMTANMHGMAQPQPSAATAAPATPSASESTASHGLSISSTLAFGMHADPPTPTPTAAAPTTEAAGASETVDGRVSTDALSHARAESAISSTVSLDGPASSATAAAPPDAAAPAEEVLTTSSRACARLRASLCIRAAALARPFLNGQGY